MLKVLMSQITSVAYKMPRQYSIKSLKHKQTLKHITEDKLSQVKSNKNNDFHSISYDKYTEQS